MIGVNQLFREKKRKVVFLDRRYVALAMCFLVAGQFVNAQSYNLAPDCSQATAAPDLIWPPNNQFVPLQIQGVTDPESQPLTIETQCIVQDEPVEPWRWYWGKYDGKGLTTPNPEVRARRRNWFYDWYNWRFVRGEGRVYDVIFKATDSEGAMCSGKVTVGVPKRKNKPVKDNVGRYPSLPGGQNCDVEPINNAPVIISTPLTDAQVNTVYQYSVVGHDPDQEGLTYSLTTAPTGMTIDATSGLIQWTPVAEQEGTQSVVVTASDVGGLEVSQSFDITVTAPVDELAAKIIANPVTGTSPLTVRFSSDVQNNNLVITGYAWDFDGDGTTDRSDSFGAPQTFTYNGEPGDTFEASLTITISGNEEPIIATQTITIENEPPTAQVATNVTNGHAPLAVTFTVTAQDPQGIGEVSIDYEGDGTFDETQTGNTTTTFTTNYQDQGTFVAIVSVKDTLGAETVITNNAITVDVNNPLDPIIQLAATPLSGNVPLSGTLTASAELFDSSTITGWRWDLDGDGEFEIQGGTDNTDTVNFSYNGVNNFYPVAEVTTDTGRTAIASLRIEVQSSALPSLSIPDSSDTINSDNGESATFTVTLPFETALEVWLENSSGGRIKTLQVPTLTSAGDYDFTWDATNDQNAVVSEGDYYVVLGYTAFGQQEEVDLRTSTGGRLSYYRRTEANPRNFSRVQAPLRINYQVDNPAEVSFFWQISFGARLMTLLEREPSGRGQYSLYWNAAFPNGQKIPDNLQTLMPGIVRYDLSDNVIFVRETPRIENFNLSSTVIWDPRREPIGLNLNLSKASTIEMVVADMDKGLDVATRVFSDIESGEQRFFWDGKNNDDQYLAPGDYRIGVRSVDSRGNRSLYWFRTQQIDY